jgi:TIR domain
MLRNNKTNFNRVFICYSRINEVEAKNIYLRLKSEKFDLFLDQEKIKPGANWEHETLSSLKNANFIIILLSKGSFERNGYAMKEIQLAIELCEKDPSSRRMIFPIKINDAEIPEGLDKFQWTDYSELGIDKMVDALLNRQKIWGIEIAPPKFSILPIIHLRESWPWITLLIITIILITLST